MTRPRALPDRQVHCSCHESDKVVYENIDPKLTDVFHLSNQIMWESLDVVGDKSVGNDSGELINA